MDSPELLVTRARRAYERGRLRHAIGRAWPVVPITGVGILLGDGVVACTVAIPLATLSIALFFVGRGLDGGVVRGWYAGLFPMLTALVFWQEQGCIGPCTPWCVPTCMAIGVVVGAWLGISVSRAMAWRGLAATLAIAGLTASLGCATLGVTTIVGAVLGLCLGVGPVWALRHAAAN